MADPIETFWFRQYPWMFGFGELGEMWYKGPDEYWTPLRIPADALLHPDRYAVVAAAGGVPAYRQVASLGRWSPMVNGDPDDPQLVFVLDANGAPDVLEFWREG